MTVSNHIYQLLGHHNCVIVPNFGGFLIQDSSAKVRTSKEMIYPPASEITFHVHLRDSDQLLLNHIVAKEKISVEAANEKIEQFVDQATQQLIDNKTFVIERVGKILINNEDTIQFQPSKIANFNTNSYGLPAIGASKINHKLLQQKQVKEYIEEKKKQPLAILFTVAASFLALLLAGGLYLLHNGTPQEQDLVKQSFSIFTNSETVNASIKYDEKTVPVVDNKKELENSVAELKEDLENNKPKVTSEEAELAPVTETENSVVLPAKTKADFHVVIGMFEVEGNALQIDAQAKTKGYKPTIIKGRKYYRVVVPYSETELTWVQAVNNLRRDVAPGAWIWETRNK